MHAPLLSFLPLADKPPPPAGANYAPAIEPAVEAAKLGYQQVLWLFGEDSEVTEAGMMNYFAVLKKEDGSAELVSPPLNGMILPGVTRDSILALARAHADPADPLRIEGLPERLVVSERKICMPEVRDAAKAGTLLEVRPARSLASRVA